MGMSIANQLRMVQEQLATGTWDIEHAIQHLELMDKDVTTWISQVEGLTPPVDDSGETREGALNGLYAYREAIGAMATAIEEQSNEGAEQAVALADEAEELIKQMKKATEVAIESILDQRPAPLIEDDDRLV